MNKKFLIPLLAVILLVAGGAIWYYSDRASTQEDVQEYLDSRTRALDKVETLNLSSVISTAVDQTSNYRIMTDEELNVVKQACAQAESVYQELPNQVEKPDSQQVMAVEEKYALSDLRDDARRYHAICEYFITEVELGRQVEMARESREFKSYQTEDCGFEEGCYDIDRQQEYVDYYEKSIIAPLKEKLKYYRNTECSMTVGGGEQFCNAIGNYFSAELDRSQVYLAEVKKNTAEPDDPEVEAAFQAWSDSYESLVRITKSIDPDYDNPYDVHLGELTKLESKLTKA